MIGDELEEAEQKFYLKEHINAGGIKRMDNVYRRDHEMPYISDDAVMAQQKGIKKAIREY